MSASANKTNENTTYRSQQHPPQVVRIPIPLKNKLKRIAKQEERSLRGQIVIALDEWMEQHEANGKC